MFPPLVGMLFGFPNENLNRGIEEIQIKSLSIPYHPGPISLIHWYYTNKKRLEGLLPLALSCRPACLGWLHLLFHLQPHPDLHHVQCLAVGIQHVLGFLDGTQHVLGITTLGNRSP